MASVRFPLAFSIVSVVVACALAAGPAAAQEPQPPDDEPEAPAAEGAADGEADPEADDAESGDEDGVKPYDEVITDEAESDEGVFTVHRIDDKVFYEIPEAELGKEFLWVSQIARTTEGVGYGGQALGNRVVKWDRRGDRVFLKSVSYAIVADPDRPIARAVGAANNDTILRAFDVETVSEEGAPVIDVTPLFATEVPEFSARSRLDAQGFARDRSFVESVAAYPRNVEVRATHTYTRAPRSASAAAFGPGGPARHASGQRHRPAASQHGEAAGRADDAATLRRARRLLLRPADRLRP